MNTTASPTKDDPRSHVYALLRGFHTAMLVTHDSSEFGLRARPMVVAQVEDGGKVWFISNVETSKVHEIQEDTRAHLVFQRDRGASLFISGTAHLVRDKAKIEQIWDEPFRVWFPKGKDDPEIVLIAVQPQWAEYWDTEGLQKIKYLFEAAKAYVTGTTPKTGRRREQHAVTSL